MKQITKFMASVLMASMIFPVVTMGKDVDASVIEFSNYSKYEEASKEELQGKDTTYYDANEPNDSEDTATKIKVGQEIKGELGSYDRYKEFRVVEADFFQVELKKDQEYWVITDDADENMIFTTRLISVIDPDGETYNAGTVAKAQGLFYSGFTAKVEGTYYIKVWNFFNSNEEVKDTNYTLKIDTKEPKFEFNTEAHKKDAYGDECENNDNKYRAFPVEMGKVYNCELGSYDKWHELRHTDRDYFVFEGKAGITYRITMEGYMKNYSEYFGYVNIQTLHEGTGKSDYDMKRNEVDFIDFTPKADDTYFVVVSGRADRKDEDNGPSTYKFSIKTVATPAPTKVPTAVPTKVPTKAPEATATPKPTKAPTATPTPATVEDFAERLYTTCLGREAEKEGKEYWASELKAGKTGASVAEGFFFSQEFIDNKIDTKEYVTRLYLTFMGRKPASEETSYWVSEVKNGMTRKDVFDGFINSTEWADICLGYGILSGGVGVPSYTKAPSKDVTAFAERLYTTCLGRKAEKDGLEWWATELANLRQTGTVAAQGFFFSPEFEGLKTDNKEYVTRLYKTFMGRDPEAEGFKYWVGQLDDGVSRVDVFNGFAVAPEFADLCAKAGIMR